MSDEGNKMDELITLHRYFIWANRMREHFDNTLTDPKRIAESKKEASKYYRIFFADDPGIFMSYWYGGLYVVIEGWKKLGFHDPDIDYLINSPNVVLLRRYRNGAFHFQKDYFDKRFQEFWQEQGTVAWVRELNKKFSDFFLRELSKEKNPTMKLSVC